MSSPLQSILTPTILFNFNMCVLCLDSSDFVTFQPQTHICTEAECCIQCLHKVCPQNILAQSSVSSSKKSSDPYFPFFPKHMYAPDDISFVYGRSGTKLSPTLAALVNGVAVSISIHTVWHK